MYLKDKYVLIIAASVFGLLPFGLAYSFQVNVLVYTPGVSDEVKNRNISITSKGCGSYSTSSSKGGRLSCAFESKPTQTKTYTFTVTYTDTSSNKKVISDGTFTVTGGPISTERKCGDGTKRIFFDNKQGFCSPYYGMYMKVSSTDPAPWGQSEWGEQGNVGFVLKVGGPPAR